MYSSIHLFGDVANHLSFCCALIIEALLICTILLVVVNLVICSLKDDDIFFVVKAITITTCFIVCFLNKFRVRGPP